MRLRRKADEAVARTRTAAARSRSPQQQVDDAVPPGLRIAGAWSWRLLAIAGVAAVAVFLVIQLRDLVIPLLVAILISALLVPFSSWLQRHGWPKPLAVAVTMLGFVAVVTGLVYVVVWQVRDGYPALRDRTLEQYRVFLEFLQGPPFELSQRDLDRYVQQAMDLVSANSSTLLSGALSVGSTAGHLVTGVLLTLFATLFLLIDGRLIWRWVVRIFPRRARVAVNGAGTAGWLTLSTFVKVQIFVAFVDAVGIGLGAWIIGLVTGEGFPLLIPIAVVVFLASFVPIVGAVLSGALAVFVALVYIGPIPAVVMLGVVLLVQQIEGHVLQPLIMGTAVKVHPLAVVLAVAAGGFLAGIPGTLFAVPFVAVLNVMVTYIASGAWRGNPDPDVEDVTTRV